MTKDILKHPVVDMIYETYLSLYKNFLIYMRIAEPILGLPILGVAGLFLFGWGKMVQTGLPGGSYSIGGLELSALIIFSILCWAYFHKAAFGVCRYTLIGDEGLKGFHPFKWKRAEVMFVLAALWLSILMVIAGAFLMLVMSGMFRVGMGSTFELISRGILDMPGGWYFLALIMFLPVLSVYAVLYLFFARYLLYFPSKSIGHDVTFGESTYLFKGWFLKFTGTLILAMLSYYIIGYVAEAVIGFLLGLIEGGNVIMQVVHGVLSIVFTCFFLIYYGLGSMFIFSIILSKFYRMVICDYTERAFPHDPSPIQQALTRLTSVAVPPK
jgi:hypothetical protein